MLSNSVLAHFLLREPWTNRNFAGCILAVRTKGTRNATHRPSRPRAIWARTARHAALKRVPWVVDRLRRFPRPFLNPPYSHFLLARTGSLLWRVVNGNVRAIGRRLGCNRDVCTIFRRRAYDGPFVVVICHCSALAIACDRTFPSVAAGRTGIIRKHRPSPTTPESEAVKQCFLGIC